MVWNISSFVYFPVLPVFSIVTKLSKTECYTSRHDYGTEIKKNFFGIRWSGHVCGNKKNTLSDNFEDYGMGGGRIILKQDIRHYDELRLGQTCLRIGITG
jgi:hypothetical protein